MASELPLVRRRPTRVRMGDPQRNRDSNIVRASVLETALELGFSQNSTVANWIFNNPLSEESEDLYPDPDDQVKQTDPAPDAAEAITPTFTSGSNSTSDESSSLNSPGNNAPSAAITTVQVHMDKPSVTEPPHVHFDDFPTDQLQLFSPFALSLHDVHHAETEGKPPGKLPRDTERSRSQDDGLHSNPSHSSPSPGPSESGYASEGQYLSKGKASKGKGKFGKEKGTKGSKPTALDMGTGGEKDGDYASDGGYLSASSSRSQGKSPSRVKSRAMAFFRRRSKRSGRGSDDEDEDSIPPVPAIPVLPRPSSPRPLERRAAPSSPIRPGFSPLTLNLTSPPASPPRRRVSKSPPPHARATSPQSSDRSSGSRRPASPLVASASPPPTILTPAATAPRPSSIPGTPLSTASFSSVSGPSTHLRTGGGSITKSLTAQSSRQHLGIPPPAPPPTLPLPQPPPSPSTLLSGPLSPLPTTPTTPSKRGAPARPIPIVPIISGSTQPLTLHRVASPFRPLLSPRTSPATLSHCRNGQGSPPSGKEATTRHRTGTAGFGSTPAFLQRRIQHGPPPSPRHPPPDAPLPPSPNIVPSTRPRTPIVSPSKFHEHFSSVSSVPLSHILATPPSMSPSRSIATLSESSSGLSVRSSHISSASERSKEMAIRDSLNVPDYSRPTTSASATSEVSYGQPIRSTLGRPAMNMMGRSSDRSDTSSSVYSPTTHGDSSSVSAYTDDDADVDEAAPTSYVEESDDASMYPPDDKTAGRRTMYLLEHGELDENDDEIMDDGNYHWGGNEALPPPPLPPLPLTPMPTQPGPGYF